MNSNLGTKKKNAIKKSRSKNVTFKRPHTIDPGAGADLLAPNREDLVALHQAAPAAARPDHAHPQVRRPDTLTTSDGHLTKLTFKFLTNK